MLDIRQKRESRSQLLNIPAQVLETSPSPSKVHKEPPFKKQKELGIQIFK